MLASQYIYTACGKDRNGAFSLWAKSTDITEVENNEIREMMIYKLPVGLPYEPTQDDIEELFPQKYAYFFLSTGKACIAQATYVGRVYSDLDKRWGNYIIHAFVFDKNDNIAPYSLIGHSIFKRYLTEKEWHDDPIPDSLPQIDIPESGEALTQAEINTFFDINRQNQLKLLIQTVISSSIENPVHFHEEPKHQKYWLKALSLCLPKVLLNKISVCSMFSNTLIPGNISSQIQIRINRPDGHQFSYAQESQRGKLSLDLVKNIHPPDLKPSRYAVLIVNMLTQSIFETVKYVLKISDIKSTFSVNIDQASDLLHLALSDYTYFSGADEIYETILFAVKIGYEKSVVADHINKNIAQIDFTTQQKLALFDFISRTLPDIDIRMLVSMSPDTNEVYNISQCGLLLENYKVDEKKIPDFFSKTSSDAEMVADLLFDTNLDSSLKTFSEQYLPILANIFIWEITSAQSEDYANAFQRIFKGKLENAELKDKIVSVFLTTLLHLKTGIIDFLIFLLRKYLCPKESWEMTLGNLAYDYFEKLSTSDRKKTFADLLSKAEPDEKESFQTFFDEFNKTHKKGLFGLF